jgi:hypothetical protein
MGGKPNEGGIAGSGGVTIGNGGTGASASGGAGGGADAGTGAPASIKRCTTSELAGFGLDASVVSVRLLYPYDGTLFPRGLPPPPVMWSQTGAADAVLVRMQSTGFSYEECFGLTVPTRVTPSADAWAAAAARSLGPNDPVTLSITTRSGTAVSTGSTRLFFAPGWLDAVVYYMTYSSPLAQNNGAVLKLTVGQQQPAPFLTVQGVPPLGPCIGCHSVSANGTRATAAEHAYGAGAPSSIGRSYTVSSTAATLLATGLPDSAFAGFYPDGSRIMTNGTANASQSSLFFDSPGAPTGLTANTTSRLIDPATKLQIPAAGWDNQVAHAVMPAFSPDGKRLAYNDFDQGGGHSLWLADFDARTNTFSNRRLLFNDAIRYPGWPSFTPDSKRIVFTLGTRDDFASQVPDFTTPVIAPNQSAGRGRLMVVDVTGGQGIPLEQANGFRAGVSYLPLGDNDRDYYPAMAQFAAGGFHWVFFTSRRSFGNLQTRGVDDPLSKKVWVSAIDPNIGVGTDPSRPAFYLPGQELGSGNFRPVVAPIP